MNKAAKVILGIAGLIASCVAGYYAGEFWGDVIADGLTPEAKPAPQDNAE